MRPPDATDHRLLALYRRYLGEPERTLDVFVGFALFFGGIAIGTASLVLFLSSVAIVTEGALFWQLREVAIVLGMLGLPTLLLSIVVLLPVAPRAVQASLAGVVVTLMATGVFVATYPQAWNVSGTDYSPHGITVYSGGLAVLIASTGAALVALHVERVRPAEVDSSGGIARDPPEDSVTDEEVQRDIEETVSASELTWGGVEATESRRLQLSEEPGGEELDASGFDVAPSARTDAGVDDSVDALRKLRGWQPTTERGSGVDDQTNALKALRERPAEETEETGWIQGVVDRFRGE